MRGADCAAQPAEAVAGPRGLPENQNRSRIPQVPLLRVRLPPV